MVGVGRVVSRVRGAVVVALAGVVAVLATAVAPPVAVAGVVPGAVTAEESVVRWGGADRYVVSANISETNFDPGVGTVYVANGLASADALAAGPVAGMGEGPILLVKKDSIPSAVAAELDRLDPARIVVLGGVGSVSAAVESKLGAYATDVVRWGGADRYVVSALISKSNFAAGVGTVFVANGLASADALAAGPVAGMEGGPILLVKKDSIPASVAAELDRLGPGRVVVLGGTGSVSAAVESKLGAYARDVVRWGGADRYAVSANISTTNFAPGVGVVYLANGLASADALAAGPVAAMTGGPILLVKKDSIPATVAAELERLNPSRIVVLGGTGSVATTVENQLPAYIEVVSLSVVAWGLNDFGQATVPDGLSGVTAIAGGAGYSLALKDDGTVIGWGRSDSWGAATVPADLTGVTDIAAGVYHGLALKDDGTVVAWGDNEFGEATVPDGLTGVTAIDAGMWHSLALKNDGTVVAWGSMSDSDIPSGLSGVIAIAAGHSHCLALKDDGTVVAWGNNWEGQTDVPPGLTDVTAIAAGGGDGMPPFGHSMALKGDGTVVAWGSNWSGEATVPAGLAGVTAIAAGASHSLALKDDGTVVAWGWNEYGQATVPADLTGVTAIAAGMWHSLVLTKD